MFIVHDVTMVTWVIFVIITMITGYLYNLQQQIEGSFALISLIFISLPVTVKSLTCIFVLKQVQIYRRNVLSLCDSAMLGLTLNNRPVSR